MLKLFSVFLISFSFVASKPVSKLEFYNALKSNDKSIIDKGIEQAKSGTSSNLKNAYLGALTMKSAQFPSTPKEKIAIFKEGKTLLEASITKEPKNGEFRFIRIAMQEKSPKILRYTGNIDEDKKVLFETYESLDIIVKKAIKKYTEESTVLSTSDFK